MSIRTIIEINHDLAHEIDTGRFEFCNAVMEVLRDSSSRDGWQALERFGIRLIASGHHSDDLVEKVKAALEVNG